MTINRTVSDGFEKVFIPMDKEEVLKRGYKVERKKIGIKVVEGFYTEVPSTFAKEYNRMQEAEYRAELRAKRCLIPNGKGGFLKCPESNSCSNCKAKNADNFATNLPLSLNRLTEAETEGDKVIDISDAAADTEADAIALAILDDLLEYLGSFKDKNYQATFKMLYDGFSTKEIADVLGLPWSTTKDQLSKVRKLAQEHTGLTRD